MTTKITSANITNTGVSAGSYTSANITVNAQGQITSASSGGGLTWAAVQTTGFTAAAGNAYPCNTTSAAFTVTLPASPTAGQQITLTDYAGTFATNNLTINPNGLKINGNAVNAVLSTNRASVQIVYVDSTQGWVAYSGFAVTTLPQTFTVDFLVVAGGGGGTSGGGGAGGYRTSQGTSGGSPGTAESALSLVAGVAYSVIVGAGGKGKNQSPATSLGLVGNDSTFATITSSGGGWGGGQSGVTSGNGGSGGGGGRANTSFGTGTANQGRDGGRGDTPSGGNQPAAGGGGASQPGTNGNGSTNVAGNGGSGITSPLDSTARGGGGGGTTEGASGGGGSGGSGGGGAGGNPNGSNGTANTGGGGGGAAGSPSSVGGNGGSGVILIRIPDTRTATFSAGVTQSSTTGGGYKLYTVTATSTTSETVTFS